MSFFEIANLLIGVVGVAVTILNYRNHQRDLPEKKSNESQSIENQEKEKTE